MQSQRQRRVSGVAFGAFFVCPIFFFQDKNEEVPTVQKHHSTQQDVTT